MNITFGLLDEVTITVISSDDLCIEIVEEVIYADIEDIEEVTIDD